jgi:hypothetical protein
MKSFFALTILLLAGMAVAGQTKDLKRNQFADFSVTAGKSQQSFALSYVYNWKVFKKKKFEIGLGLRNTLYTGVKNEYITAGPARLTRTNTTPFLIFFAGQKEQNFDTLEVQRPLINLLNITANLGYNINAKWYVGFNIDLIGFSLGRKSSAVLKSNGINYTEPAAKPTAFNVLLTGDHDKGSLNSEFFVRYRLNKRWSLKGVYQFLFEEYETSRFKQTASDGTVISRFRNKANNLGVGVAYNF